MKDRSPTQPWRQFEAHTVPSSLDLDPVFFQTVPEGARVLDIGCGSGRCLRDLLKGGYQALGLDINFSALQQTDVPSVAADALQQPFQERAFDACILQAFMTTLTGPHQRRQVLAEAARVLKPQGHLYLAVFAQTPENPVYQERYQRGLEKTGELGTFAVTRDGTPDAEVIYWAHHYSEEELRDLLREHVEVTLFRREDFESYHGNRVNGFIVLALKAC